MLSSSPVETGLGIWTQNNSWPIIGQTKVNQLDLKWCLFVVDQHDIVKLQVCVYDLNRHQVVECVGQLKKTKKIRLSSVICDEWSVTAVDMEEHKPAGLLAWFRSAERDGFFPSTDDKDSYPTSQILDRNILCPQRHRTTEQYCTCRGPAYLFYPGWPSVNTRFNIRVIVIK